MKETHINGQKNIAIFLELYLLACTEGPILRGFWDLKKPRYVKFALGL